jgi:hypothetical protein
MVDHRAMLETLMDIDNPTLDMRRRDSDLQRGAAKEGAGEAFAQQRTASRRVAHTEGERRVAAPTRRARGGPTVLYFLPYKGESPGPIAPRRLPRTRHLIYAHDGAARECPLGRVVQCKQCRTFVNALV